MLVVVVVASGNEHPGPVGPAGPALQAGGEGLGDAELGQHNNARAVCDRRADQPVDLLVLFVFILRADREGPPAGVSRKVEISQGAVGMAGCHDGVAIYDSGELAGKAVVEDDLELCGPFPGEPDVTGLIQAVGQPPRRGGRGQCGHMPEVRTVQGDRITNARLVRAPAAKGLAEAVAVLFIQEFGQQPCDSDGGKAVVCGQCRRQCSGNLRAQFGSGRCGGQQGPDTSCDLLRLSAAAGILDPILQYRVLVPAQLQQMREGDQWFSLGGDGCLDGRDPLWQR